MMRFDSELLCAGEEKLDPRYTSGPNHSLGWGPNGKGRADRESSDPTGSEKSMQETGLTERKPL